MLNESELVFNEDSKRSLLRWASFSSFRKGHFCVGHRFRVFEKVTFVLGIVFEDSKRSLLRWGTFSSFRKGHFCVGERFRRFEKVTFALGNVFEDSKRSHYSAFRIIYVGYVYARCAYDAFERCLCALRIRRATLSCCSMCSNRCRATWLFHTLSLFLSPLCRHYRCL